MIKKQSSPDGRLYQQLPHQYIEGRNHCLRCRARQAEPQIPRAKGAWRVIPNLYLGNAAAAGDAATLRQLKVTAVQSVGPRSEKVCRGGNTLTLMRVAIQDNDEAHILPFLEEACTWINAELAKEDGVVLVHCRGGMNRSATMVAAFLVWKFPGMTAAEAIAVVRQARPAARFGRGEEGVLQRDLRQWELDCAVARESREQDGQGCVDGEAEKEPAPTGDG